MPRYQSTIWSPASRPITPPSARNGPKGTACLRAAAPCLAISARPKSEPTAKRDQQRRRDRAAEVEAHDGGELDVAHPHPARIGERHREEQPARRRARRSPVPGRLAGSSPATSATTATAETIRIVFGISRSSRSVSVIVASVATKTSPSTSCGRFVAEHDQRRHRKEQPGGELDQRVADRDPLAAVAAAAAQQQPGDDRDVVVGGDLGAAARRTASAARRSTRLRGTRWATTLRKLPVTAPPRNPNEASSRHLHGMGSALRRRSLRIAAGCER